MSPEPSTVSVCALLIVIAISCTSRINVGLLAIPMAWIVGLYAGRPADAVLAGFPSSLFITLTGVTILFTLAGLVGIVVSITGNETAQRWGRVRVVTTAMSAAAVLSIITGWSAGLAAPIAALLVLMWNGAIF